MGAGETFDPQELTSIERALGSLVPRPSGIDRDRLLFLAGRASVENAPAAVFGRWAWPAATLLSSATAAVLLVLLLSRPAVDGGAQIARGNDSSAQQAQPQLTLETKTDHPAGSREPGSSDDTAGPPVFGFAGAAAPKRGELPDQPNYLQLRAYVLAYGVEALPVREPAGSADRPASATPQNDAPRTQRELLRELLDNSRPGNRS